MYTLKFTVLIEIEKSLSADCICYCILGFVHIQSWGWMPLYELCFLSFLPFWSYSGCGKRSTFLGPACLIFSDTDLALMHLKLKVKYINFTFLFLFGFLKKVHWNSWLCSFSEGCHKKQVTRTLLITKQQDITHNRSANVFIWSHDIILRHREVLVSNSMPTNQPHDHTVPMTARASFQVGSP